MATATLVTANRRKTAAPAPSPDALHVSKASTVLTFGVLLLSAFYFLVPVWWLIVSATKDDGDLFATNGLWFGEFNLFQNIADVLTYETGAFPLWMVNSVIYAGVGGAVATLLGAACGYALAKYDFWGRGALFAFVIAGVLLPSALLTIPLYLMFSWMGIVNTYLAVLLPAFVSPFAVYLCRVYAAASVSNELIEAARIDGASELRIFFSISLRIMSPALVTVFLFTFVAVWNNFFLPLVMLSSTDLFPVTLGLYQWFSRQNEPVYSLVITGAFLSVIPLVIAFLALQRFWRAGLTAGSVKS